MAFLVVRKILGICQPTSVVFPGNKKDKHVTDMHIFKSLAFLVVTLHGKYWTLFDLNHHIRCTGST